MKQKIMLRVWVAAAVAAVLVTGASPRTALAGDDSAGSLKDKACGYLGCKGGSRACADAEVELSIPEVGSASVTWHCYEGGAEI